MGRLITSFKTIIRQLIAVIGTYLLNISLEMLDQHGIDLYLSKLQKYFKEYENAEIVKLKDEINELRSINLRQQRKVMKLSSIISEYNMKHIMNVPFI